MKIIAINTRLVGGASKILIDLKKEFSVMGFSYKILYGYGSKGGRDSSASAIDASRIVPAHIPIANFFAHSLSGRDLFSIGKHRTDILVDYLSHFDAIHLNVIHSHVGSFEWFASVLTKVSKPVIWTHHDSWIITGRCAITSGCNGYLTGCKPCQNTKAYPPALLDFSASSFLEKRRLLKSLTKSIGLVHVAPSHWIGEQIQNALGTEIEVIHNSVSSEFFNKKLQTFRKKGKFIFTCRDLRDRVKTHGDALVTVAERLGSDLTIIGDNPDNRLRSSGAVLKPYFPDRKTYISELLSHETLIFLSISDSFSLTTVEARVLGLNVICLDSPVSEEIQQISGVQVASTVIGLVELCKKGIASQDFDQEYFRAYRMAKDYSQLFQKAILS